MPVKLTFLERLFIRLKGDDPGDYERRSRAAIDELGTGNFLEDQIWGKP